MHASELKPSWTDQVEETLIAVILGIMTLITFANVIARYVFNSNILWALETTVFLFAWLVLIGAAYAVKNNMHIGVDIVVRAVPPALQRLLAIVAVIACLIFSFLVVYGAFQYWWPFASERAWYEVDDIPMPETLQFLAQSMNEGERWEKLPRFIPYFCLPLGFGLLLLRFIQVALRVMSGEQLLLVASHDTNDSADDNSDGDSDSHHTNDSQTNDVAQNNQQRSRVTTDTTDTDKPGAD